MKKIFKIWIWLIISATMAPSEFIILFVGIDRDLLLLII